MRWNMGFAQIDIGALLLWFIGFLVACISGLILYLVKGNRSKIDKHLNGHDLYVSDKLCQARTDNIITKIEELKADIAEIKIVLSRVK